MLLINKSDFLSESLIQHWNQYFLEKGVKHIFFSALKEQKKIDNDGDEDENEERKADGSSESDDDSQDEDVDPL